MTNTHEEYTKRLCEGLGICWHEVDASHSSYWICRKCGKKSSDLTDFNNPTLLHPEDVLDVLRRYLSEEEYMKFIYTGVGFKSFYYNGYSSEELFIKEKYIVSPPTELLKKAVDFVEVLK